MSIRATVSGHINEVLQMVFKQFLCRLGLCSKRCKGFPILHIKVSRNYEGLLHLLLITGVLGAIRTSSMLSRNYRLEDSRLTLATE
jgi:hypothetical protein